MKLTKYEHACFVVEEQGQKLIVDPGAFTQLPDELSGIIAVIITHEHADHFLAENIDKIRSLNPNLTIFGSREVIEQVSGTIEPEKGKPYHAGSFELEFYGNLHEFIRDGIPQPSNLGVNINQAITYPGDSFDQDPKPAKVLLAPVAAPWLRIREATEFVSNSQQELIIPTHDAVLSEIGKQVHDSHLRSATEMIGKKYQRLAVGESIEF